MNENKALEIKTSMLFNLDFAKNTISSYFFFFFLIIDLYFLIPAIITRMFDSVAKLVIPIGIPIKEAQPEMETHPVIVEITISGQYNSNLYKLFYASYSLIHFDLFLLVNNFLFHLFFAV